MLLLASEVHLVTLMQNTYGMVHVKPFTFTAESVTLFPCLAIYFHGSHGVITSPHVIGHACQLPSLKRLVNHFVGLSKYS